MKPWWLYRFAAGMLCLFTAGHTIGFLRFKAPLAAAVAVRESMDAVRFKAGGTWLSFGGFYVGFGLYVSAYLLFSAYLAWHLGGLAKRQPRAIGSLGLAFFLLQVVSTALSGVFFALPQVVFSGLVALSTGWAAMRVGRWLRLDEQGAAAR